MSENIVLHCQDGNSDKVYIACVSDLNSSGMFDVTGKWGRRGKRFSEQSKGSFGTIGAARSAAMELVRTKRAKGYVNISDSEYDGPLTMSSPDLAKYLDGEVTLPKPEPTPKSVKLKPELEGMPKVKGDEVCVTECKDNDGMEERFDLGIAYIVTRIAKVDGKMMAMVIDNEGKEAACYRERFGEITVE